MSTSASGPQAAALLEIAHEISRTLSLNECLQRICDIARNALEGDRSSVILWSDRRQAMVAAADVGTPPDVYAQFRTARFTADTVPEMEKLVAGQSVVVSRESRDPKAASFLNALAVETQLIAPLRANGPPLGALNVSYERRRDVPDSALMLLDGIAWQAAVAIERARLFRNMKKVAEFRAALTDLSLALAREPNVDRIVELVCDKGRAAFDADGAMLCLAEGDTFHVRASAGAFAEKVRGRATARGTAGSLVFDAYAGERAILVNQFQQSLYAGAPLLKDLEVAAVLAAPLRSEGHGLGVLLFTDAKEPYRFSQVHAEEATILATTAAAGLENARLVHALREESRKLNQYSRTLEQSNHSLAVATAELQAVNREMEDLLYIASHDLRAPLINIQGFAYEASRELERVTAMLPPDARSVLGDVTESLGFIDSSSRKMDTLISALLDVSRIASRDLVQEPVDLTALLERIAQSFRFVLQEQGIVLRLHPLPATVADSVRIEQVFSNLIDNAIKYIGDGRREIEVGGQEGDVPRYFVRDTGIGITAAELPKVFRLFRRGRVVNIPGEGIGLTMVRKIVERHGGRIWIESQEGQGTTVWFTIGERPPAETQGIGAVNAEIDSASD